MRLDQVLGCLSPLPSLFDSFPCSARKGGQKQIQAGFLVSGPLFAHSSNQS